MNLKERCAALGKLGNWLKDNEESLDGLYRKAFSENGWFDADQCRYAIKQAAFGLFDEEKLLNWAAQYNLKDSAPKRVGIIMAGNIPAVGLHDFISVFISGHKALLKFSEKDKALISFLLNKVEELSPGFAVHYEIIERMQDADAVIATGNDNSSRYFEYYFSKIPSIIRGNRNSIAILDGTENAADLSLLADDIFKYYGLGCRSISKIYIPRNFNFGFFMQQLDECSYQLLLNSKYKNNFDYNRSVYLLNQTQHLCNDSLILAEDNSLQSRIATLHYEFYDSIKKLEENLHELRPKIQCIVSSISLKTFETIPFGQSQQPTLEDYADGIDTMEFLKNLNLTENQVKP
jgi:hypothetical protein